MSLGKRKITFEGKTSKKDLQGLTVEGVRDRTLWLAAMLRKLEPAWNKDAPWVHEGNLAWDDLEKLLELEKKLLQMLDAKTTERVQLFMTLHRRLNNLEQEASTLCKFMAKFYKAAQKLRENVRGVKKSMAHVLQKTEFEEEAAEAFDIIEMLQDEKELSVDDFYEFIGDDSDEAASKFGGGI